MRRDTTTPHHGPIKRLAAALIFRFEDRRPWIDQHRSRHEAAEVIWLQADGQWLTHDAPSWRQLLGLDLM